jgi:hypothetical protein
MIAGTAATTVALGTVFARVVIRKGCQAPICGACKGGREQALYRMRRTSGS